MKKIIAIILTSILVSLYFFPFEFSFLPGINTKMILAVIGAIIFGHHALQKRVFHISTEIFVLYLLAGLVSLIGFFSMVYNNTSDNAYASYIISMTVWLAAAYAVISIINKAEGKATLKELCKYLTIVCISQCVLALLIHSYPAFKNLVDSFIIQGQNRLTEIGRLYGIGASLDTAGTRFSACLIIIGYYLSVENNDISKRQLYLFIIAFLALAILGNFVARTTSIGALIALSLIITKGVKSNLFSFLRNKVLNSLVFFSALSVMTCIMLYRSASDFRSFFEFGFEGFISLVEEGEWKVSSNEQLKSMIIFPDNEKTWVIGDAYFDNPYGSSNYIGDTPSVGNFYMGTDIGYLRFIFYFGLVGLLAFSLFIAFSSRVASNTIGNNTLPVLLLTLNYIIWLKVSTDIFVVFALLICLGSNTSNTEDELIIE